MDDSSIGVERDSIEVLEMMDARIIETSGHNNDTRKYGPTIYRRAADELRWLRARNASLEAEIVKCKREKK